MSDPQLYPDANREIDAEGIDPDMPSTDDERIVPVEDADEDEDNPDSAEPS